MRQEQEGNSVHNSHDEAFILKDPFGEDNGRLYHGVVIRFKQNFHMRLESVPSHVDG